MGTLAYTYVRAYPPAGSTQIAGVEPRHSINQEIKQSQRVAGFTLENNVRLQQTYAGDRAYGQKRLTWKFLQRVHYRLGAEITAPSWFRSMPNYYAVYDEVIVGFGSHSGTNALKQDRTYGAFGWKLNQNTRLELGYMYQYRPVANGIIGEHNNALQISILSDAPIKHVFGLHR